MFKNTTSAQTGFEENHIHSQPENVETSDPEAYQITAAEEKKMVVPRTGGVKYAKMERHSVKAIGGKEKVSTGTFHQRTYKAENCRQVRFCEGV